MCCGIMNDELEKMRILVILWNIKKEKLFGIPTTELSWEVVVVVPVRWTQKHLYTHQKMQQRTALGSQSSTGKVYNKFNYSTEIIKIYNVTLLCAHYWIRGRYNFYRSSSILCFIYLCIVNNTPNNNMYYNIIKQMIEKRYERERKKHGWLNEKLEEVRNVSLMV